MTVNINENTAFFWAVREGATLDEIVSIMLTNEDDVQDAINRALEANRIHICEWMYDPTTKTKEAVYIWGKGVSVPKPDEWWTTFKPKRDESVALFFGTTETVTQ